jgi:hypothetical protein
MEHCSFESSTILSKKHLEAQMFGYGIIGTLVIICLIVWLLRRA